MDARYPEIEPYDHGLLDVGDGNVVYWETCGNPDGVPALVLHGGPGSGCTAGMRRYFDPAAYRIVLFDQRGCGRSKPHVSDPAVSLSANTTQHLLADIERLRRHLSIHSWLIRAASWGSVLALASAASAPGAAARSSCSPAVSAGSSPQPGRASATACPNPTATAT